MKDPLAEVLRQPGHGVRIAVGPLLLQLPYLGFQAFRESLVGIDGQNPIVRGLLDGEVLLSRLSIARAMLRSSLNVMMAAEICINPQDPPESGRRKS